MLRGSLNRRKFLATVAGGAVALPFFDLLASRETRAANGKAERVIVFYFPDGVVGPSQDGQPSMWHATGGESNFTLPAQLESLEAFRDDCLFFNGLSMGPADSGSHPGGAKKLLTATDGGFGESIDHLIARGSGSDAPFRHLYLGAMANQNNASGDKHISYPSAGQTVTPEDDPSRAFDLLFDGFTSSGDGEAPQPDPTKVSVIDAALEDVQRLQSKLGDVEKAKLALHLESLREVEKRIKGVSGVPASCEDPAIDTSGFTSEQLYEAERLPAILQAQTDLMVLAMSCGLTRVGVLQASHHTSDLIMSRFAGSEMYDPGFDMRSHQASHYGPNHNPNSAEFSAYLAQRRWWVEQFSYLLQSLAERPDPLGGGSMLDTSVVLLCTEVCDGNTHLHDNMPFVLAGHGGGSISPGRLLSTSGARHSELLTAIAHAMGDEIPSFGDAGGGPLPGVLA